MADTKRRKYEDCTICGDQVIELLGANDGLDDSGVLERIKELNHGDFDVSKISRFVVCKMCRDKADIAYKFVKNCQALMNVQPSVYPQQLETADTQIQSPELIIIVNQLSKEVDPQHLRDLFSEYGRIVNFYFKESTKSIKNFAHITLSSEDETLKVMNAAQNKELCYDGKPLVVTRVSEDCSPMDILPDVCLSDIFLHIHRVEDKIQIGRVCKHWKEVLARSWSNIRTFSDRADVDKLLTVVGLGSILKGGGNFLKSLKLIIYDKPIDRVTLISEYCKNIENFQLEFFCDEEDEDYQDETLVMFQRCRKLRRLFIDRVDAEFNYNHLQYLPEEMLEIRLFSTGMDIDAFIDLAKFQNLEVLALWNFTFDENTVNGVENLVNLKYFSVDGSLVHPSNIREIPNLKKLKRLELPNLVIDGGIDDGILIRIIQGNRDLEHLDISGNRSITDRSLQYLARLSKLKVLYMKNLSEVTATDLMVVDTLEDLDVDGCSSIVDWTLIMFIDKCPKLSRMYAAGVATWRLIIYAEESIELSPLPRHLEIFTNKQLAERWLESEKPMKNLHVSNRPRSSEVDEDDWRGWYGDVEKLI